ncbi:MAG: hypothetical protein R3326_04360 [Gemmatimonadota bacterium]|nr:hypothetical protein [Gemmatimonadota bacterium]
MPNGAQGTPSDWDRLEAPVRRLDAAVEAFADRHQVELVENDRGWPSRRMRWTHAGIERRIDVFLQDEEAGTVAVWAAAWIDRGEERHGRSEWLRERADPEALAGEIDAVLEAARRSADSWGPEDLEPWAEIEEPVGWRSIVFIWIPFLILAAIVLWAVDWILESLL